MEQNTQQLILSHQQSLGYDLCGKWLANGYDSNKPFFYIGGYAGTGKTTILSKLTETIDPSAILQGAFTNKAALVMRKKGNPNATTCHKLCYVPVELPMEEIRRLRDERTKARELGDKKLVQQLQVQLNELQKLKFTLRTDKPNAKLIVLDEVSMLNGQIARDLLSFKIPIIVLGDPGQLPPIEGEGYFTQGVPDVMLTEIHRQALGNPIIELSMLAREGKFLRPGPYGSGQARVLAQGGLQVKELLTFDQILCGKHASRMKVNRLVRQAHQFTDLYPHTGEKLICLKNTNLSKLSDDEDESGKLLRCFNGLFVTAETQLYESSETIRYSVRTEDGDLCTADFGKAFFKEYQTPGLVKDLTQYDRQSMDEFDFGYAITVHKSQGSQWDSVLVWDDKFGIWDKPLRRRWLYTAITRAAEKLVIAQ